MFGRFSSDGFVSLRQKFRCAAASCVSLRGEDAALQAALMHPRSACRSLLPSRDHTAEQARIALVGDEGANSISAAGESRKQSFLTAASGQRCGGRNGRTRALKKIFAVAENFQENSAPDTRKLLLAGAIHRCREVL
jgi:hypothetical protein